MYSGDEVSAVVFDFGSYSTRIGFAGEDSPRRIVRTTNNTTPPPPPTSDGSYLLQTLEEGEAKINTLLKEMFIETLNHPLLMGTPPLMSDEKRIKVLECLLEKYNVPACFLCRNPVLSAFASGRSTCLVIDVGASGGTVSPVYEGYTLLDSTRFTEQAAAHGITQRLDRYVTNNNIPPKISRLDFVEDVKHAVCRSWRIPPFDAELAAELDPVEYVFPDGSKAYFGPERFEVCEPGTIGEFGLTNTVLSSFEAMDADIRRSMTQEIIMIGGGSLLDGLPERIVSDLSVKFPTLFKPKLSTPGTITERRYSCFVGGSVLASLGSFQQLWCTKSELLEYGGLRCVGEKFIY
jgi:actin-related protein